MLAPAEPLPLDLEFGETPQRVTSDVFELYKKRDRHPCPDAGYLRDLAARDPIGLHLSVRNWRNAYIKALGSALLLFAWRYIKQQFETWLHLGRRRGESFPMFL